MDASAYAKKYLEDIISFFGLNTEVVVIADTDEVIELAIPSSDLNGFLIGQKGDTLRALQALTSGALKNKGYASFRVSLDIADYKRQHTSKIEEQTEAWATQVKDSGEPLHLRPMHAADRRVVHQYAAAHGLTSESVGDGRERHIVLSLPAQ